MSKGGNAGNINGFSILFWQHAPHLSPLMFHFTGAYLKYIALVMEFSMALFQKVTICIVEVFYGSGKQISGSKTHLTGYRYIIRSGYLHIQLNLLIAWCDCDLIIHGLQFAHLAVLPGVFNPSVNSCGLILRNGLVISMRDGFTEYNFVPFYGDIFWYKLPFISKKSCSQPD